MTPEQFEVFVEETLRALGAPLSEFEVDRREHLSGSDGSYEIDVTARFQALDADFLVLVECKHHRHPIKRETVQVLRDRVVSTRAHKGMLFATTSFQSGAVGYARHHRIALVRVTPAHDILFQTRGTCAPTPTAEALTSRPQGIAITAPLDLESVLDATR